MIGQLVINDPAFEREGAEDDFTDSWNRNHPDKHSFVDLTIIQGGILIRRSGVSFCNCIPDVAYDLF